MTHIKNREHIAQMGLSNDPYAWSVIGLWRDADGGLYLGTDSGCSCYSPWESHTEDSLTGPLTLDQAVEEIVSLWRTSRREVPEGDVHEFLHTAVDAFLRDVNTSWTVYYASDLPRTNDAMTVTDADGVKWTRADYWEDFETVDPPRVSRTDYEMRYPLTVEEES